MTDMTESTDLTAAVEAARHRVEVTMPLGKWAIIEAAISAAAPLIEAQVREMVAAEIEAERDRLYPGSLRASVVIRAVMDEAARIVRGVTD